MYSFSSLPDADELRILPEVTGSAYGFHLLLCLKEQGYLHHHGMLYLLLRKDGQWLSQAWCSYNIR